MYRHIDRPIVKTLRQFRLEMLKDEYLYIRMNLSWCRESPVYNAIRNIGKRK